MGKVLDPANSLVNVKDLEIGENPTSSELVINEMLNPLTNLKTKTDLNSNLILGLTKGSMFADIFENKMMANLVETVSLYLISNKRMGRTELKDMAKSLSPMGNYEPTDSNMIARLMGGSK